MLAGFSIELGQALAQALRPEKDISSLPVTAQAHFFPKALQSHPSSRHDFLRRLKKLHFYQGSIGMTENIGCLATAGDHD